MKKKAQAKGPVLRHAPEKLKKITGKKAPTLEFLGLEKHPEKLNLGTVCKVPLSRLRPTQATIGFHQAEQKAHRLRNTPTRELESELLKEPIPVVVGPDGHLYVTDHHHLAAALWMLSFENVLVEIVEKYWGMKKAYFWAAMRRKKKLHLYDEHGVELPSPRELPICISDLRDNVFQSLAYLARKMRAYASSKVPVSDFKWPDFFRAELGHKQGKDLKKLAQDAVKLAHSSKAEGLPGYLHKMRG